MVFSLMIIAACTNRINPKASTTSEQNNTNKGLKDHYKDYFTMGVAVTPQQLKSEEASLVIEHFNSITAENAMKMGPIHPQEDRYFWRDADSIVAFAEKHQKKMRGHTLCWHAQAPDWMFKTTTGDTVSKELLLKRLKDHITAVVSRYKGKIYAWDVVNEAIDDRAGVFYRNTAWYRICGEEFIEKAFEYAHAADPDAILFYNDYNTENPVKRDKIFQLAKRLLEKKIPIHGIGLQGHWSINHPSREELERSIRMFSSLGLQVQITELDVSVYAGNQGGQLIRGQKDTSNYTPEMERLQVEKYRMIFDVLRQHKKEVTGVTFWNISDRNTWLDGRGKKNFPLLFGVDLQPKKAYYEVVNF